MHITRHTSHITNHTSHLSMTPMQERPKSVSFTWPSAEISILSGFISLGIREYKEDQGISLGIREYQEDQWASYPKPMRKVKRMRDKRSGSQASLVQVRRIHTPYFLHTPVDDALGVAVLQRQHGLRNVLPGHIFIQSSKLSQEAADRGHTKRGG